VYGYPPEHASRIALREIQTCVATASAIERVLLVAFDARMQRVWLDAALEARPR
jgi:O-acetyl-ADP-ribose deacetylase (regulator of RNase III)